MPTSATVLTRPLSSFHATTTSTKTTTDDLVWGDLVYDDLDRRLARFVRREGSAVVLMDRNTLTELPDWRHPSQVRAA